MKPHSSFRVTTPYVRMSTTIVSNLVHRVKKKTHKAFAFEIPNWPSTICLWFRWNPSSEHPSASRPLVFRGRRTIVRCCLWYWFSLASPKNALFRFRRRELSKVRPEIQKTEGRIDEHSKVGASIGKGWWVVSDEEVGGKLAINDSWRGMITLEGASLKRSGNCFCMLKVFLSSLIWKSHKSSSWCVIVSESSMSPGTSVSLYRMSDFCVR